MISKITELTIYESPDGKRTVYVRVPRHDHCEKSTEYERWLNIFNTRRDNLALDELCNQIEMIYELSKKS
jgi:hypothetical protein